MTYKEVTLQTDKYFNRGTGGVARAQRGSKIKLDGKMRIVAYMIYKMAYIIEFWKWKALKNHFYFKNEEIGIYFWNFKILSQLKAL